MNNKEEKIVRIEQLRRLGYNTPRIMQIPQGTVIDKTWEVRMMEFAGHDKKMTVRTYHPFNESRHPNGPFYSERPVAKAMKQAERYVRKWNVLWQEAIDRKETRVTGAITITGSGRGSYDIRKGPYYVRDACSDPQHSVSFDSWNAISDTMMRKIVHKLKDVPRELGFSPNEGVILEFALQKKQVGLRKETLLLWEWRKREIESSPIHSEVAPRYKRLSEIRGEYIYGLSVEGLPMARGARISNYLLGGKATNLQRMLSAGFRVPLGFVLSTRVFREFGREIVSQNVIPAFLAQEVRQAIESLRNSTVKTRNGKPLLVSVRSSPVVSMPGMMLTVLNVGLESTSLKEMLESTENRRLCYDLVNQFIRSFGGALGYAGDNAHLNRLLRNASAEGRSRMREPSELLNEALELMNSLGYNIPTDPIDQIDLAIRTVFRSWFDERPKSYRLEHEIPENAGTAVIVQQMVFGNLSRNSGTGVGFSRDPTTGVNRPKVEYAQKAQGESIVSGRETPKGMDFLRRNYPTLGKELADKTKLLERLFSDTQDFEFVNEKGRLYFLQSREGNVEKPAKVRIACDLTKDGVISEMVARDRLKAIRLHDLVIRRLRTGLVMPVSKGMVACDGASVGCIATSNPRALRMKKSGKDVILVKETFTPEDYETARAVDGILTMKGGVTSHSAILARQSSTVCIVSCKNMVVLRHGKGVKFGSKRLSEGDVISLDGESGNIYAGQLDFDKPTLRPGITKDVVKWFNELKIKV